MTKGKIRTNQFAKLITPLSYKSGVVATADHHAPRLDQVMDWANWVAPAFDDLTAQVGGGNQDFTTTIAYKSGTLDIFADGPRVSESAYSETGVGTFHLDVAPTTFVVARYLPDETVVSGDISPTQVIHTEAETHISALKSDDSLVVYDTSLSAGDYYLPKLRLGDNGFHLRVVRRGIFNLTIHAPDLTTIDGLASYVISEDGGAIELIYVHERRQWVVIATGLHVIEYFPPSVATALNPITPVDAENSFDPAGEYTTAIATDKTFVFPTDTYNMIQPTGVPYVEKTASDHTLPYPFEGLNAISNQSIGYKLPYYEKTAAAYPMHYDFSLESEIP